MDAIERDVALTTEDAALDAEIQRLLAVDPSAEFLSGVRRRIGRAPDRRGSTRWIWSAAAAVAAAAALTLALRPQPKAPPVTAIPVPAVASTDRLREFPAAVGASPRPSAGAIARMPPARRSLEPEVIIDPRERAAFLRLITGTDAGGIPPSAVAATGRSPLEPLEPISELSVPPLPVDRLNSGGF